MTVVGIVPAAGSGERLGAERPKAFVLLGGRPLLDWSLEVLQAVCDRVVVAVPPGHEEPLDRVAGGSSRSESVKRALAAAPEATIAVVHDAARPLLDAELLAACVSALGEDGVDAAIAAAPMTDTVKEVEGDRVVRTLDRSRLWAVQTPQVFRAEVLRRALDTGEHELAVATDDSVLVEALGANVRVVEASPRNTKITTPDDLRLAERILASEQAGA